MTDENKEKKFIEVTAPTQTAQAQQTGTRRIVMPSRNKPKIEVTSIVPAVDLLLHDAKSIVAAELASYRSKVSRGASLDLKEARVVQGYLETLIKLQKEERDQARSEDLSNLSDEELMDLAAKVLTTAKPKLLE